MTKKRKQSVLVLIERYVGAFSGGVPPLPIPNRVVKPASADGTGYEYPGE